MIREQDPLKQGLKPPGDFLFAEVRADKELRDYFQTSKSYADLLARTETAYVQANGRDEIYKKFGVKMVKWLLGLNPCPECQQ